MVELYVSLITQNKWTLDRVAYPWKAQVEERLRELEYIEGGE